MNDNRIITQAYQHYIQPGMPKQHSPWNARTTFIQGCQMDIHPCRLYYIHQWMPKGHSFRYASNTFIQGFQKDIHPGLLALHSSRNAGRTIHLRMSALQSCRDPNKSFTQACQDYSPPGMPKRHSPRHVIINSSRNSKRTYT